MWYSTNQRFVCLCQTKNRKHLVKHPTAKAIGLPRLMLPVGRVWFSLCVPNHRDFTGLSSNAFPTGLTHHISKGVTLHTSCARYKCMGILYYKLVAFIPNTKDVWDFCLGGLKNKGVFHLKNTNLLYRNNLKKNLKNTNKPHTSKKNITL